MALALAMWLAATGAPVSAEAVFTALKSLEGEWEGRTEAGRALKVSYRLTANGTVLVETWTLGPTRESLTLYHRDGGDLLATHYCPIGNQPRLRLATDQPGPRLQFEFVDATNLLSRDVAHQHSFWVELSGADTLVRSETYVEKGEEGTEVVTFKRVGPAR